MSCDQSKENSNLTKCDKVASSSGEPSGDPIGEDREATSINGQIGEANIPGFEYELPENVGVDNQSEIDQIAGVNEVPRFDDFRHPYVKFLVTVVALISLLLLIYGGLKEIKLKYAKILCPFLFIEDGFECATEEFDFNLAFEYSIRICLEVVIPCIVIFLFLTVKFLFTLAPVLSMAMDDPVPKFTPVVSLTLVYHCLISFSISLSLLPRLPSNHRQDIWNQYIVQSSLGLFWMYAFINIHVFSKLCRFNTIRVRELYQTARLERNADAHL